MQEKKYLEPLANTDEHTLDEMYEMLRALGATPQVFEYLSDIVRAQAERHGPLKIGQGMGLDRNYVVTNIETGQDTACELIVFHMDFAKTSDPDTQVSRVLTGFKLTDGKIAEIVQMEGA
jgi:hypothetical protein